MKNRSINTRLWSDSFIVGLAPLDRYLFLYLLTNEHTNVCGIYELPESVIARETGLDQGSLEAALGRLQEKVVRVGSYIALKNFLNHQADNHSINKGVERVLQELPKDILANIIEKIPSLVGHLGARGISPEATPRPPEATYRSPDILKLKPEPKPTVVAKRPSGVGGEPRPAKDPELRNQALDLINHWAAAWEKTFGKKADITSWGRYLKQAMPLVKANGLDLMKALCDKYFLLFDDKLVKENQWPLGLFLTDGVINKLKNQ